ncbi:hypothetical protein [Brevibacillus laterosporus]|uniref:hypothetical protein n=1 Tax=Brevibacillus laterosporus TaxID=1465 RepID=UPI000E6CC93B|nr:hypothetical protein [Brevibacillus laterosporus]AYB37675.1 hypothetical protein D5F52_04900 [Brevibacillus laterosporus]MBM7111562.1 hypothetical protein [Brevibacillus laterosporus]
MKAEKKRYYYPTTCDNEIVYIVTKCTIEEAKEKGYLDRHPSKKSAHKSYVGLSSTASLYNLHRDLKGRYHGYE